MKVTLRQFLGRGPETRAMQVVSRKEMIVTESYYKREWNKPKKNRKQK